MEEKKEEIGEMSYRDAMKELESIVSKMESDNCDIDRLSEYTTRAIALLKFCKDRLHKTNKEVENCLEELRTLTLQ